MTAAERKRRQRGTYEAAVGDKRAGSELEWEIHVDDEGEGYIGAYEEPFGLYVHQTGDIYMFFWYVLKEHGKHANKSVNVAEGEALSVVAAMAAAEAAYRRTKDDNMT
jgi:hypothetical protein